MIDPLRLWAMARKEWTQLRRDPRSMILAFVLPLFLLLFFGYAITWDVDDIRIAVLDQDRTAASRDLVEAFVSSGYFTVEARLDATGEIEEMLVRGRVMGVLTIPPGYARDLSAGRDAEVQLLLDGSDANTATIALNYGDAIVARHARDVTLHGRTLTLPFSLENRVWYNPNLESRHMIVPGLIAVIMSIIAAMLTALTIAREWERGTMEALLVTPVTVRDLLLGKLLPYFLLGAGGMTFTVLMAIGLFEVPFRGSFWVLAIAGALFLCVALGMGLLISVLAKNQFVAAQVAIIVTFLPAFILSGFLFDIGSMPQPIQWLTYLIAARYFVEILQSVFLAGNIWSLFIPNVVALTIMALFFLGLSRMKFRKRLD